MNIGKVCIFLFVLAVLLTVFGDEGLVDYMSYRSRVRSLMVAKENASKERERLAREIHLLHDSRYIEKYARHELGMVREGDVVYRFVENEHPQAHSSQ